MVTKHSNEEYKKEVLAIAYLDYPALHLNSPPQPWDRCESIIGVGESVEGQAPPPRYEGQAPLPRYEGQVPPPRYEGQVKHKL